MPLLPTRMSLTATYCEALKFQYRIQGKIGIVQDAVDAAFHELKRKDPDVRSCSLLCVKHKVGGRYEVKKVKLEDPRKAEYELQLQASESELLEDRRAVEKDRLWLLLEPAVIHFASLVFSRIISGEVCSSTGRQKGRAKAFIAENPKNEELFSRLAGLLSDTWTAADIAGFADVNYAERNGKLTCMYIKPIVLSATLGNGCALVICRACTQHD